MKLIKPILLAAALLMVLISSTLASWEAEEIDNLFSDFGNARLMGFSPDGDMYGLWFECDGPDKMSLVYLEQDPAGSASLSGQTVPVPSFIIRVDKNKKHESTAEFSSRNVNYISIEFLDTSQLVSIVKEIANANKGIAIGMDLGLASQEPATLSLDVLGSAKSANAFLKICEIQ